MTHNETPAALARSGPSGGVQVAPERTEYSQIASVSQQNGGSTSSADMITVLRSPTLLMAKTWCADGTIKSYDNAKHFDVRVEPVSDIRALSALLTRLEPDPHACIIRGAPSVEARSGVRRIGDNFRDEPLHAVLIEVDDFQSFVSDSLTEAQQCIEEYILLCLPKAFSEASFHWQLSSSAGAPGKEGLLKVHLWFWLETPRSSAVLRAWAKSIDLQADLSVFQTVQAHYTAAPVFEEGRTNPIKERSGFVAKAYDSVPLEIDEASLEVRTAAVRKRGESVDVDDERWVWLEANWPTHGRTSEGALIITCPFDDGHSSGRQGDTSTVYFRAGSNGYACGHYNCLHASCADRTDTDFDDAVGYEESLFDDVTDGAARQLPGPILNPADPLKNSRIALGQVFTRDGEQILIRQQGDWLQHTGTHYVERSDENVKGELWHFLWDGQKEIRGKVVPFSPSAAQVAGVLDALKATAAVEEVEPPCWLPGYAGPDPAHLLSLQDGLLDLRTRQLRAHTAGLFTRNSLPYRWGGHATGGGNRWSSFLDEVFEGDQGQIDALQEVFGYMLTGDTSQQKIFAVLGPKRSGKGTIGRLLGKLIGPENVVGPTLASMTGEFGMQPLIGKLVALISDIRISPSLNKQAVIERLLMVSGEDRVSVNRKYKTFWTGHMPVRFFLVSNELPLLPDGSGALMGRFFVFRTPQSFYDREDPHLEERLAEELPAILRWALDGRDRLNERGHFIQPPGGQGQLDALAEVNNPVSVFVGECCVLEPEAQERVQDLFNAWGAWCARTDRWEGACPRADILSRNLQAAFPRLSSFRPRAEDGSQSSTLRGIALKAEARSGRGPF